MDHSKALTVSLDPATSLDTVCSLWQDLEARATPPFFLSWYWIGSWLAALPERISPMLLSVRADDRLVGLAILTKTRRRRNGFVRTTVLSVNESGETELDGIAIEYNGFLAESGLEPEVATAVIDWLVREREDWDEIVLSGISAEDSEGVRVAAASSLGARVVDRSPYYCVDLATVRESGKDYLSTLSRNTRYQIRRAIRGYEETGPIRLTKAASTEEAFALFGRLRELHQQYWNARGLPGAFGDEFRHRFHQRMIETAFPEGGIHIIEVAAGDDPIGYLYNFCYRGVVSNYQSGFRYSDDSKLKPGLVSHALAIQDCLDTDAHTYDFLMGRHRYKQSLSNRSGEIARLVLQRPRLRFRIEDALRQLRDRFSGNKAD